MIGVDCDSDFAQFWAKTYDTDCDCAGIRGEFQISTAEDLCAKVSVN